MTLTKQFRFSNLVLVTTAYFAFFGAAFQAQAAFDPNFGADSAVAVTGGDVLYPPKTRMVPTAAQGFISPLAPVQMPAPPLYPTRIASATPPVPVTPAAPVAAIAPAAPSVVAAPSVAVPAAPAPQAFIAPAPVLAQAATPASPVATMTPEITVDASAGNMSAKAALPAPVAAIAPAPSVASVAPKPLPAPDALSSQSKTILSQIPSRLDTAAQSKSKKIAMERTSPEVKAAFAKDKDAKVESYKAAGLDIKVRRPGLDTGFELNRAYTMLMGGQTQEAVDVYKNILSGEPSNQDALFGLAATYHRLGELEKARPLYGALLKLNPNHREALNNFLVLVSDESPQEALAELERLEQRNPDFSPIPAQEAILLGKLGYTTDAKSKMLRAIELAPENLTYKYNLAIMLDRQGNYADAGALYRLLIDAALKGEKIPAALDILQKRLNFITTAAVTSPQGV
jgi:Flp pilus assembly protein TadD